VDVGVAYAIDEAQMLAEIEAFRPDLLLSPFLKRYLPPSIYEKYDTFVFHPGPRGDRGPNALEYALLNPKKEWGVTILKATEIYDGGDIYAEASFEVRECYKASLYRQEVVDAALTALDEFFVNYEAKRSTSQLLNPMHQKFTQKMRSIDWQNDTTQEIIDKI
jgi:putative two-component system hydrogenase maturation factor HypX/HoxX